MSFHLLQINYRALRRQEQEPVAAVNSWQLYAGCGDRTEGSCRLFQRISTMADQRDRRAAVAALVKLTQVAASGQPLAGFYDEKQCHVIHRFTYLGRERMIWRIRQSNIRLAFYYGAKRLIFLADVFPKRRDKLTKAEKSALEAEVMAYIEAERGGKLVLFSAGDPATNS